VKVNQVHMMILKKVQHHMNRGGSLGGCMKWEATWPHEKTIGRTFEAMIRNGLLESFVTKETMRQLDGENCCYNSPGGHKLVRPTMQGWAVLAEEAIREEDVPLAVRVAKRLKGVPAEVLKEAAVEYDTRLYVDIAEAVEKGD
jgi:hypothetical protein